jgi:hypothetical protein
MHFVYSTLAAPQAYTSYVKNSDKEMCIVEKTVHIKGGTGVMDARNVMTPRGVVTQIDDEELKCLMENPVFKMHIENGFITVETKEVKVEKVADRMNQKDKSRPVTPDDFEKSKDGKSTKLKRNDV